MQNQLRNQIAEFLTIEGKLLSVRKNTEKVYSFDESVSTCQSSLQLLKAKTEALLSFAQDNTYDDLVASDAKAGELLRKAWDLLNTYLPFCEMILHPDCEVLQSQTINVLRPVMSDMGILLGGLSGQGVVPKDPETYRSMILLHDLERAVSTFTKLQRQKINRSKRGNSLLKWFQQRKVRPLSLRGCFSLLIAMVAVLIVSWLAPRPVAMQIQQVALLFSWAVMLLWFPTYFVPRIHGAILADWMNWFLCASACAAIVAYGIWPGALFAIILASPIFCLFGVEKGSVERNPQEVLGTKGYLWIGLSQAIVGILTMQPIWFVGLVIWFTFAAIAGTSFKHFRHTFDMIASLSPDRDKNEKIRSRMLYLAMVIAILICWPNPLKIFYTDSVISAYGTISVIAFGLLGILIGVQAIIPSISTWGKSSSGQAVTPLEIQEMKLYVRHQSGLAGFMQIFFALSLFSLLGIAVTTLLDSNRVAADLSADFLLSPLPGVISFLTSILTPENWPTSASVLIQTLMFAGIISLFLYSFAAIYFLFVTTTALTLPIHLALRSIPAQVEETRILSFDGQTTAILERVIKHIKATDDLSGIVIKQLVISSNESSQSHEVIAHVNEDFLSTKELVALTINLARAIYREPHVGQVAIDIARSNPGSVMKNTLLSVTILKHEMSFLTRQIEDMSDGYKLWQLGASIRHHLQPESQLT